MATKVGPSTVSYGIGVQNRYSAFLEDEDSFALSNIVKRPNGNQIVNKQKNSINLTKSGNNKTGQRSETSLINQSKKQDGQQKNSSSQVNNQQNKSDMRRQQRDSKPQQSQQQQANGTNQSGRNFLARNRNSNHDGTTTTTNGSQRFSRAQNNGPHQTQTESTAPLQSKENHNGQPFRPNASRSNTKPRMQKDDKKAGQQQQQHDGQQMNGHLASNDEEKARRQQRRLNNLRFKDPERRERRNQVAADVAEPQAKVGEHNDQSSTDQRGQRIKRDFDKNRARPRRPNLNGEPAGDSARRETKRERPIRQRNGFSGSQSEVGGRQEKPKLIPNFSDKSDFPSLAS